MLMLVAVIQLPAIDPLSALYVLIKAQSIQEELMLIFSLPFREFTLPCRDYALTGQTLKIEACKNFNRPVNCFSW